MEADVWRAYSHPFVLYTGIGGNGCNHDAGVDANALWSLLISFVEIRGIVLDQSVRSKFLFDLVILRNAAELGKIITHSTLTDLIIDILNFYKETQGFDATITWDDIVTRTLLWELRRKKFRSLKYVCE